MYSPRHARPSCLPLRAAVGSGLTAVLLPIALAAPALAEEPTLAPAATSDTGTATTGDASAAPSASPTAAAEPSSSADARQATTTRISASTVGTDGRARIGVRVLVADEPVEHADVVVEALSGDGSWKDLGRFVTNAEGLATARLPFSRDTRVRATSAETPTRTGATSPTALVRFRQPTTMRISAGQTDAAGRAPIGVRLLKADGAPVRSAYVAVEALSGDGTWTYIGRMLTDDAGLAKGRFAFSRDTRVRSTFSGNTGALARTSPEAVARYVKSTLGERAGRIAAEQAGKPYRYGATGPGSFDCSGFTTYIYKTRLGRSIPRTSAQQAAALPSVAQSAKRPGDLLFFRSGGRVSHVAVYAGGGRMWAAPTTGDRVKLQSVYSSRYSVGRVV